MSKEMSLYGIRIQVASDGWYEIVHSEHGVVARMPTREYADNACMAFALCSALTEQFPQVARVLYAPLFVLREVEERAYNEP